MDWLEGSGLRGKKEEKLESWLTQVEFYRGNSDLGVTRFPQPFIIERRSDCNVYRPALGLVLDDCGVALSTVSEPGSRWTVQYRDISI